MFQIASLKIICTDSTEILFSQILLKSFFKTRVCRFELLYHLPKLSFFTDPYCAGVSNKHCLLTFFIFSDIYEIYIFNMIQTVVDNFNSDISSKNGRLTTHSLAVLITQTSKIETANETSDETINRLSHTKWQNPLNLNLKLKITDAQGSPKCPQRRQKICASSKSSCL